MSRWFRHYAGMMRDDKLVRVAIRSKQTIERVVWIYGAILESAAEIDDDGRYDFDTAEAAYFLRADENDVAAIVAALDVAGRLSEGRVVRWGDRQFKSDRSAERQARYRERQRNGDSDGEQGRAPDNSDGHSNGEVTSLSRRGDAPETETELDTEREKPKAKALVKKFVLPADIPAEPWGGWLESRKSIRKSPTDHAKQLAVTELRRLRDEEGWPPGDVLNHCAMNSYQGIYPPKRDQRNERSKQASLASVVHRILGDGGIDRGVGEDAGPGSPNFDERGTTRALAARGG